MCVRLRFRSLSHIPLGVPICHIGLARKHQRIFEIESLLVLQARHSDAGTLLDEKVPSKDNAMSEAPMDPGAANPKGYTESSEENARDEGEELEDTAPAAMPVQASLLSKTEITPYSMSRRVLALAGTTHLWFFKT